MIILKFVCTMTEKIIVIYLNSNMIILKYILENSKEKNKIHLNSNMIILKLKKSYLE